jgi:hypothetical protein
LDSQVVMKESSSDYPESESDAKQRSAFTAALRTSTRQQRGHLRPKATNF